MSRHNWRRCRVHDMAREAKKAGFRVWYQKYPQKRDVADFVLFTDKDGIGCTLCPQNSRASHWLRLVYPELLRNESA